MYILALIKLGGEGIEETQPQPTPVKSSHTFLLSIFAGTPYFLCSGFLANVKNSVIFYFI